jgi:hypothetical protein
MKSCICKVDTYESIMRATNPVTTRTPTQLPSPNRPKPTTNDLRFRLSICEYVAFASSHSPISVMVAMHASQNLVEPSLPPYPYRTPDLYHHHHHHLGGDRGSNGKGIKKNQKKTHYTRAHI